MRKKIKDMAPDEIRGWISRTRKRLLSGAALKQSHFLKWGAYNPNKTQQGLDHDLEKDILNLLDEMEAALEEN